MPIAIICPSCGHRAGAKEEWIGRQVKCPGCGERITVESPRSTPAPQQRPPAQQRPAPQQRPAIQPRGAGGRPVAGGQRAAGSSASRPASRTPAADFEGGLPDVFGGLPADDPLNMALGGSPLGDPLGPALGGSPLGARPAAAQKKAGGSGKMVWIAAGAVGALLLLVVVGVVASGVLSPSKAPPPQMPMASDAPPVELPVWSADAALLTQLGAEVSFDRYSLRLPPGYQPLNLTAARRAPPGVKRQTWAWCDAAAADGTRHVIEASLADAAEIITHRNDLDAEINAYLQNAQSDASSAKYTPGVAAKGQVCGGPFARLTYSVATPQTTVHTISFLGFDGNDRMLTLVCAGKDPEGTEAFKLLEASLLSLKRN